MQPEQKAFLEERTRESLQRTPALRPLLDWLLLIGGQYAVLHENEEEIDAILTRGYVQSGRGAILRLGEPSDCHRNTAHLWGADPQHTGMVTGYALSPDNIWRPHSWASDLTKKVNKRRRLFRIIETTARRTRYLGVRLSDDECYRFWVANR